jgi:dolichol-phosphate hexosyltransferase
MGGGSGVVLKGRGEVLSVRQRGKAPAKSAGEEGLHLHASAALSPDQPRTAWRTVSAARMPQPSNSFNAEPLKLSILMAAYNEESTIAQAIDDVLKADCPCDIELIVVDDGSTDATPTLLEQVDDPRVMVHRHQANQGKGAALLAAASFATGTYVLPFDADLEYAAEDISRVLDPIVKGRCQVVYGVRLFGCNTVYQTYLYAAGNRLLTRLANILFNAHLTDLHTCLKLMPLVLLRSMDLREKGFGLDSEITARLLRRGIRPFEVPVTYYGRSHAEGKKIMWHDAIACAWILLRVRMRARSRREPADDRLEAGGRSHVAIADSHSQLTAHAPASVPGDGDEFIRAVTG